MKKIKFFILLCLFAMISIGVSAEEIPNDEIWYTSSDGKIVTPYQGNGFGSSIVSNTYTNGKGIIKFGGNVTSIVEEAFYLRKNMTSVTIPNSVTEIGARAFRDCSGLTSVTIGNSVTSIGSYAFDGCDNVKELIYAEGTKIVLRTILTSITSVTIPNSVTSIGNNAFYLFKNMTSVTIPNSVTSIGDEAFFGCSGLTSVTIPNSVTSIGSYAFDGCSGLTSVTIPNSVTEIGVWAFEDCSCVENLYWNSNVSPYCITQFCGNKLTRLIIGSSVTKIDDYAFYGCSGLTSVTIPNSVNSIGYYAFVDCEGLTSLTIGNSVISIDKNAFRGCSNVKELIYAEGTKTVLSTGLNSITSVTIPNSVTSIGDDAFSDCSGLTSVTIPNSVTSIGDYAFQYCSDLKSVTIPNSVNKIGKSAFQYCRGLTSVYVEWKDADKIPSISSYVFPYSTCSLYVPSGTKSIYQGKEYWKKFKSIVDGVIITINNMDDSDGSIIADNNTSFTLYDNINSISVPKELEDVNITYTRNFEKAGVWQAWYMPFDVDFDDMKSAYDVAQIHGVLLDKDNNAVLAFLKLDKGTVNANTPYVVRPKKSGEVAITTTTDLQPTQSNSFLMMSATDKYTIGGVYEQTTTPGNWYALNLDGQFQKMDTGVYLRPFRIYMTIDPREDNPYATSVNANAKMDIVVLGDDETTGIKESLTPALSEGKGAIYNLSGLRVNSIQKGQIYIMNGKKYIAK